MFSAFAAALSTMPEAEHATGGVAFGADGRLLATAHMRAAGQRARTVAGFPALQFNVNDYDYLVRVRELPPASLTVACAALSEPLVLAYSDNR